MRCLTAATAALALLTCAPCQISPGFRAFGTLGGTETYLVDTSGVIVHTWPSSFLPGASVSVLSDGSLLRCIRVSGGPGLGGTGGGVQRVALDGSVAWDYRYSVAGQHWSHHDACVLPNGNVLLIAWEVKSVAEAIAAGRNPALVQGNLVRVDHVVEVQPTGSTTGAIIWEWHVLDHLVQDLDPTKANYGVVANHPELVDFNFPGSAAQSQDWNHINSVDYDPVHDWVILSSHNQSEIWIIDHATTTTEAAGHSGGARGKGGDLLYRWGNPQAYRAGSAGSRQLYGQHSARVIKEGLQGAGNVLVFNNNYPGGSRVWELVLPIDPGGNFLPPVPAYGPIGPVWTYAAPGLASVGTSSCERLPNGNTLIASGGQGHVFEVTAAGQVVWSYAMSNAMLFNAQYVDRQLWANCAEVSGSAGGTVGFDLIAGSPQAGRSYVLLASASGTSPGIALNSLVFPLNWDFVGLFTLQNANTPILSRTMGTLDALGRATASLQMPAGVIAGPVSLHFAFAVLDATSLTVTATSNPEPLVVGQ